MTASTGSAIGFGIRAAFVNLGAVTWRYLASLFSALPFAVCAAFVVDSQFASSLAASEFAQTLDPTLTLELIQEQSRAIAVFGPVLVGAIGAWVGVSAFMTAATIGSVNADHALRTNELFAAGGRGFGRLIRLLPFGLFTTALFAALPAFGAFKLHSAVTEDWISEPAVFSTKLVALLVGLLAFGWANAAYDLMKVEAVAKGEHRARWAFVRGLLRGIRHPVRLLRVYLPFAFVAILITVVGSIVDVRIVRDSWIAVGVGFAFQQAMAYVRAWLSVATAGAEVALTRRDA